jgi:hypothetical protein
MELKRILARDIRAANEKAVAQYGPDVLVISSGQVNGLTELIVAVDLAPLTPEEADQVADAGGRLVLSPNLDPAVVRQTKARGLWSMPGVATPSEGFQALAAGADALKLFPAEMLGPPVMNCLLYTSPSPRDH